MGYSLAIDDRQAAPAAAWWRESAVLWLMLLVGAAYFTRVEALPMRGEEPTRAQVAREMVAKQDWVVPREQGEPIGFRPPFQNWVNAVTCLSLGSWDRYAVRLPSLLAMLLTSLLIYGYSRTFLGRIGALAAGAAFLTLPDAFQMGRQAETEALFVLLVSASLLLWHWGTVKGWPDVVTFCVSYALMMIGLLTKGMQAPTYFVGAIGVYMVLSSEWRRLFSWAHLAGILVAAGIFLAWAIPFTRMMGMAALMKTFMGDPAVTHNASISKWVLSEFVEHLIEYPLEIAAGMLPWCLMLPAFVYRSLRESLRSARPQILFLGICLAIAFPTCWIPPGGLPRYFFPLFPCVAILIGLTIERTAAAPLGTRSRAGWQLFLASMATLILVAAVAVAALAIVGGRYPKLIALREPPLVALGYCLGAVAAAVLILRARRDVRSSATQMAVLALAGFMVISIAGVALDIRIRRSENAAVAMRELKEKLPPGQALVSLGGRVDSLFTYLYGMPLIAPQPWPGADVAATQDFSYFCFEPSPDRSPLPFAWEEVGVVPLDRNHHDIPERVIVVGHRLPGVAVKGASSEAQAMGHVPNRGQQR